MEKVVDGVSTYGVIFLSLSIMALLGEATTIGSDGTFRSSPVLFQQVHDSCLLSRAFFSFRIRFNDAPKHGSLQ